MLCDLHTHTRFSFDGQCTVAELCDAALCKGVDILAITEHYDFDTRGGGDHYKAGEARRAREMAEAKAFCAPRMELLCGIELGQPHLWPEKTAAFLAQNDFDVVIGSLHDLRPEKDIYRDFDYNTLAQCDAVYAQFFDEAEEMLRTCDIDVFGHYDYPMRLMRTAVPDASLLRWRERMRPFLHSLAHSGIALEINSSAYRRWQGRPAGEDWLLQDYLAAGGTRVTVGSDAHKADYVASGIPEACALLRRNGISSITVYEKRKPRQVSIL
ncbi:MAG: histidinol-phosphatase HisJ family protein [Clostridiaceae bacterium]|nr:histidinol-phosphatase HisJ family protein [Clostridiaceae bacterium]